MGLPSRHPSESSAPQFHGSLDADADHPPQPLSKGTPPTKGSPPTKVREFRGLVEATVLTVTNPKLRVFRHSVWLAAVILLINLAVTGAMLYYYKNKCSDSFALLHNTWSGGEVTALSVIKNGAGVTIKGQQAFGFSPDAEAKLLPYGEWCGEDYTSADYYATPAPTPGSNVPAPTSPPTSGRRLANSTGSSSGIEWFSFDSGSNSTGNESACSTEVWEASTVGCLASDVCYGSKLVSVWYQTCTNWPTAVSNAISYAAYVDLIATLIVVIIYGCTTGQLNTYTGRQNVYGVVVEAEGAAAMKDAKGGKVESRRAVMLVDEADGSLYEDVPKTLQLMENERQQMREDMEQDRFRMQQMEQDRFRMQQELSELRAQLAMLQPAPYGGRHPV